MTRAPIPNCPQSETPIHERAWTDEQRLARLRELAELWKPEQQDPNDLLDRNQHGAK